MLTTRLFLAEITVGKVRLDRDIMERDSDIVHVDLGVAHTSVFFIYVCPDVSCRFHSLGFLGACIGENLCVRQVINKTHQLNTVTCCISCEIEGQPMSFSKSDHETGVRSVLFTTRAAI